MLNEKLDKLNAKDKMLIAKAASDIAAYIYKSNTEFVLNQIMKSGNYESKYGQFTIRRTAAKTIKTAIADKKKAIMKATEELMALEELASRVGDLSVCTDSKDVLVSKHYAEADDIAKELLKTITGEIQSPKLDKALDKYIKH